MVRGCIDCGCAQMVVRILLRLGRPGDAQFLEIETSSAAPTSGIAHDRWKITDRRSTVSSPIAFDSLSPNLLFFELTETSLTVRSNHSPNNSSRKHPHLVYLQAQEDAARDKPKSPATRGNGFERCDIKPSVVDRN